MKGIPTIGSMVRARGGVGIALLMATGVHGLVGPCDIFKSAGTPCVAAHSVTRALYQAYTGNLYQVRRASDHETFEVTSPGSTHMFASSLLDSFCAQTTCRISVIYDQSGNGNHLVSGGLAGGIDSTKESVIPGPEVRYWMGKSYAAKLRMGTVYRCTSPKGMPTGDQAESIYMVTTSDNTRSSVEYGSAPTTNSNSVGGAWEALYFGMTSQTARGTGDGPWAMADFGVWTFAGGEAGTVSSNQSISAPYVLAMLKGRPTGFALKAGSYWNVGMLKTLYEGPLPSGITPTAKDGGIALTNSRIPGAGGEGVFCEGAIVAGYPGNSADSSVHANFVDVGYGKSMQVLPRPVRGEVVPREAAWLAVDLRGRTRLLGTGGGEFPVLGLPPGVYHVRSLRETGSGWTRLVVP